MWFLGWNALGAIFFYWLDGLLALWGLGTVAVLVTIPELPIRGSKLKLWLVGAAATVLTLAILSIPSLFTAMFVITSFKVNTAELLHLFKGYDIWFSLLIVICLSAGQTISELRLNPSLTIKQTGLERGNMFIHRTLLMGLLAGGSSWGHPPQWVLATYVLAVACLFTYTQLNPERYLRFMGSINEARAGKGDSGAEKKMRKKSR